MNFTLFHYCVQVDGLHDEPGDSSDDSSEKLVIADEAKKASEKSPAELPLPNRKRGRPKQSESSPSAAAQGCQMAIAIF